jgi:hypothetical protein
MEVGGKMVAALGLFGTGLTLVLIAGGVLRLCLGPTKIPADARDDEDWWDIK